MTIGELRTCLTLKSANDKTKPFVTIMLKKLQARIDELKASK